jgi:hypothetical protein
MAKEIKRIVKLLDTSWKLAKVAAAKRIPKLGRSAWIENAIIKQSKREEIEREMN